MSNTNLAPILHRFRDVAFNRSKIAILGYPSILSLTPPTKGFPWDDLRKILLRMLMDSQRIKWRGNIEENFSSSSRAHKRYIRQMTDRRTTT